MPSKNFYNLLKDSVKSCSEQDVKDFFKEEFLDPLTNELDGSERPAEEIRQQRKQTIKIQNKLLTYRQK
jgi:hypothetical protein